jgi:anti-sigma B factor antagonist
MSVGGETSFELKTVVSADRRTLVLSGEIDLLVSPQLEEAIRRLCAEGAGEIVLDLRRVTFMDSTALRATVAVHDLCKGHGCAFSVIPGPTQIQTLFELTGLAASLPFQTDGERSGAQESLLHEIFSRRR